MDAVDGVWIELDRPILLPAIGEEGRVRVLGPGWVKMDGIAAADYAVLRIPGESEDDRIARFLGLLQEAIERIVATVPGGVANVQDIYPLAPLQEGILYHHASAGQGDPYVMQAHFAFDHRPRLETFAQALRQMKGRPQVAQIFCGRSALRRIRGI